MKYYRFEPATGEFLEEFESDKTYPVTHRSITTIEPPERQGGKVRVFDREAQTWSYAEPEQVILVTKEAYEAEADKIHLELGRAITEWSIVEQWLCDAYKLLTCMSGSMPLGLSSSFYAVKNFRDKLAMVDALVQNSGMPKPIKEQQVGDWKPIRILLEGLSGKRNRLAHGSIICPKPSLSGRPHALPVWVPYFDAESYRIFKLDRTAVGQLVGLKISFEEWTADYIAEIRCSFIEPQRLLDKFISRYFPGVPRA